MTNWATGEVRQVKYVPKDEIVAHLADGWYFPNGIVETMRGHHGAYSALMERCLKAEPQSPPLNEPAKPQAGHG